MHSYCMDCICITVLSACIDGISPIPVSLSEGLHPLAIPGPDWNSDRFARLLPARHTLGILLSLGKDCTAFKIITERSCGTIQEHNVGALKLSRFKINNWH